MLTDHAASLADIAAILDLAALYDTVEQLNRPLHEGDLISSHINEDLAHNLHLWHDDAGKLVAFARLKVISTDDQPVEGRFWLYVHPDIRGQGVEAAMLAWVDAQTHAEAGQHGGPAGYQLHTAAREDKQERRDLLERQGFHVVRYFFTMHRSFAMALDKPTVPAGFTIRPVDAARDVPAYVAMANAAFAEHWGHQDDTEADMRSLMQDPSYRAELDLLAIAPNGELAGFCLCTLDEAFTRQQAGFVSGLGTHPRYRGLGLGRALLLAGLQRLRALRLHGADISVDGENPTGAVKLYESVGFVAYETWIVYKRP